MSYRVGTTNFNLPQTEGTDKRDWSDTNQAFADLDAAVGQAGTDASQALTLATTAQTTADGAVTTAQGAVTTANSASATATSASEAAALARTEAQSASTVAGQANTTAQNAQQVASNADTVALAAQGNIGTMADLQTTDKSSLVAAINEVLAGVGGGVMVKRYDASATVAGTSDASVNITFDNVVDLTKTSIKLINGRGAYNANGQTTDSMNAAITNITASGCTVTISNRTNTQFELHATVEVIEY